MSTTTLFSKLLNKVRVARIVVRKEAQDNLWLRNKLNNPAKRQGYRIEEKKTVTEDSKENSTYQLWKLIDEEEVSIDTEVITRLIKNDDWGMKNDDWGTKNR